MNVFSADTLFSCETRALCCLELLNKKPHQCSLRTHNTGRLWFKICKHRVRLWNHCTCSNNIILKYLHFFAYSCTEPKMSQREKTTNTNSCSILDSAMAHTEPQSQSLMKNTLYVYWFTAAFTHTHTRDNFWPICVELTNVNYYVHVSLSNPAESFQSTWQQVMACGWDAFPSHPALWKTDASKYRERKIIVYREWGS